MDSKGNSISDPRHGAKGVGPGPKVGDLSKKLGSVPFFLQGVILGVRPTHKIDVLGLNLVLLAFSQRVHQGTRYTDAATGGEGLHHPVFGKGLVGHHLDVTQG